MNEVKQREDWRKYIVTIGGIEFRPVSMASLTMLYSIGSPLVAGGELDATDYCVFAWIHAAPLMEVITSVKAGNWYKKAMLWGAECPTEVFASFTVPTLEALVRDISKTFIEPDTGFIPFPLPSPCKPSWWKRVWTSITRLWKRG